MLLLGLSAFAQEKRVGANRDAGTATKKGYTNNTYKVDLKLPGSGWMLAKDKVGLIQANGEVAEYWHIKKNIRVVISIEENQSRVINIAERNIADLTYAYRKLKVIDDRNWFRKGPHYVYAQTLEAQNMVGARFKVQNYVIMKKQNRNIKISITIITPLNSYHDERFFVSSIYKNLEVK